MPADGDEGVAEGLLDVGCEGARAVMILVVALARPQADEAVLNGTLHKAGHVVVEWLETIGKTAQLVVAVLRTVVTLHGRIAEVDAADEPAVWGDIAAQEAAQTMVTTWTGDAVADDVGSSFLAETFFNLFFFHVFSSSFMLTPISGAKIIIMCHTCKDFSEKI